MEERKGFLTPEQEKTVDNLIDLKGIAETLDGTAIKLADNKGLEMLKGKIVAKLGTEALPLIYEVIDTLFIPLKAIADKEK